jgi:hypothetical protein
MVKAGNAIFQRATRVPAADRENKVDNIIDLDKKENHCLHDGCPQCHGSGKKENGEMCIHMLSCPCPKCSPYCMTIPSDGSGLKSF